VGSKIAHVTIISSGFAPRVVIMMRADYERRGYIVDVVADMDEAVASIMETVKEF